MSTITRASGNPIGFAGLWDAWKDREGHWLQSFAIVTTEANELMGRIHPRMPVILRPRDYDRWLDRGETKRLPLDLLRPYESDENGDVRSPSQCRERSQQLAGTVEES